MSFSSDKEKGKKYSSVAYSMKGMNRVLFTFSVFVTYNVFLKSS